MIFLWSIHKLCCFVLLGDFNIHIHNESFNLIHYETGPAHVRGHTLDHVFTLGLNVDSNSPEYNFILDHNSV